MTTIELDMDERNVLIKALDDLRVDLKYTLNRREETLTKDDKSFIEGRVSIVDRVFAKLGYYKGE